MNPTQISLNRQIHTIRLSISLIDLNYRTRVVYLSSVFHRAMTPQPLRQKRHRTMRCQRKSVWDFERDNIGLPSPTTRQRGSPRKGLHVQRDDGKDDGDIVEHAVLGSTLPALARWTGNERYVQPCVTSGAGVFILSPSPHAAGTVATEQGWATISTYRNKGYLTEAARVVLTYISDDLNLDVLVCIDSRNAPSIRVAKKLSFEKGGELYLGRRGDETVEKVKDEKLFIFVGPGQKTVPGRRIF